MKKPVTKDYVFYDSLYVTCLEEADAGDWLLGAGGEEGLESDR